MKEKYQHKSKAQYNTPYHFSGPHDFTYFTSDESIR
jgi:hypothetical protein